MNKHFLVKKQESFGIDNFHNSQNRRIDLHFVAKNVPFTLVLESSRAISSEDSVEVFLVYENDSNKSVEGIQKDSYSFIAHLQDSTHCSVEVRINALSSQHEGANFLLKFVIGDEFCFSNPIKVLSKRTQIEKHLERVQQRINQSASAKPAQPKRKSKKQSLILDEDEDSLEHQFSPIQNPTFMQTGVPPKKETAQSSAPTQPTTNNSQIMLMLQKLQQQQAEQKLLLEKVASTQRSQTTTLKKAKIEKDETSPLEPPSTAFPQLLTKLLQAWQSFPAECRQEQLYLALDFLSPSNHLALEEMLNIFQSTLLQTPSLSHAQTPVCPQQDSFCPPKFNPSLSDPCLTSPLSYDPSSNPGYFNATPPVADSNPASLIPANNFDSFFSEYIDSDDFLATSSPSDSACFQNVSPVHLPHPPRDQPIHPIPLYSYEDPNFSDE